MHGIKSGIRQRDARRCCDPKRKLPKVRFQSRLLLRRRLARFFEFLPLPGILECLVIFSPAPLRDAPISRTTNKRIECVTLKSRRDHWDWIRISSRFLLYASTAGRLIRYNPSSASRKVVPVALFAISTWTRFTSKTRLRSCAFAVSTTR